jgi:hypothetical protein
VVGVPFSWTSSVFFEKKRILRGTRLKLGVEVLGTLYGVDEGKTSVGFEEKTRFINRTKARSRVPQ